MPSTTNANNLTVVHASSNGIATMFPDVCKTPSPAGPVPIPYPNVAQSSDTADGSTTVKVDGNPIMLKKSNYSTSTGDEAGSAMGVASNKNKGKAEPVLYSFDVKVDGQNVFRLTDMMLQNSGSPPNTPPGTNVQPGIPPSVEAKEEACKKTEEKKKEQETASTSWGKSGIVSEHRSTIQTVCDELKVVLYFRRTKDECAPWISAGHQPKPHSVLAGTTITGASVGDVGRWLSEFHGKHPILKALLDVKPPSYPPEQAAAGLIGVVASTAEQDKGRPIKWVHPKYFGKWMTGDYDLFQVAKDNKACEAVTGAGFAKVKNEINKRLGWDAIQHGPQAQWEPTQKEVGNLPRFKMPELVKANLRGAPGAPSSVLFAEGRKPMQVLDTPLTVVAGKGVVICLDDEQAVKDAMICDGCAD